MSKNTILSGAIGTCLLVVTALYVSAQDERVVVPASHTPAVYLATSTLPVAVAGLVEAANSATIYAQTAGVVVSIPQREGASVRAGMLLVEQATPVADAQVNLARAESALASGQQSAAVAAATAAGERAAIRNYSAEELAVLRTLSNDQRVVEARQSVASGVQANLPTILTTLDFINTNRSLFSAAGLEGYTTATELVYGTTPTYFTSVLSPRADQAPESLVALSAEADTSLSAAQAAAAVTRASLLVLEEVLATAEKQIFDRRNAPAEETKTAYREQRAAIAQALRDMVTVQAAAEQVFDATLEDAVSQNLDVAVSDIDFVAATTQAQLAITIAERVQLVGQAAEAVTAAERSLGRVAAPYSGTVARVLVEEGEYVLPGTPLLELVGDGGVEMMVSVPRTFAPVVAPGQRFLVAGEEVGFVDRVSTRVDGHGAEVILALHGNGIEVGQTLRGEIDLPAAADTFAVPRRFVLFASGGAFLSYQNGEQSRVEILYDAGDTLYLSVVNPQSAPLSVAASKRR